MKIEINKNEILKDTGVMFENEKDYLDYLENLVDFLENHNKNYTKTQYFKILEIKTIVKNLIIK